MNRTVLIVGAILVVPLLVFLAIGFRFDPRKIDSPLIGKPAPSFTLEDLDGNVVSLEELRGSPVLINFWATWCRPCVIEHPILEAAAERWKDRVHFVGVIYQDEPSLIRRFVASRGAWGPSLVDTDGRTAIAYGVYGAPETFILDRNGIIVEKVVSVVNPRDLTARLDSLLADTGL